MNKKDLNQGNRENKREKMSKTGEAGHKTQRKKSKQENTWGSRTHKKKSNRKTSENNQERRKWAWAEQRTAERGMSKKRKAEKATPKLSEKGLDQTECWVVGRQLNSDPFLDKPDTLPQALCTQFLSNLPSSLSIPIMSYERKGGGNGIVFWALMCLSSSSEPRLYLVVLHVSVGPIFQQQKRCLHIIDSSCPVKCRFSCRENHSYEQTE